MHRSRGNRIGIISESVLFRAGLKALLRDTDFEAAFEAANVDGLLPGREEASGADIFLLDSGARSARLAEDVRDLLRTVPRASVVVLADALDAPAPVGRSAEPRVGKECVSTLRT